MTKLKKKVLQRIEFFFGEYGFRRFPEFDAAAIQFTLKLREEHQFRLAEYTHVGINVTPKLPVQSISLWERPKLVWRQTVDYGIDLNLLTWEQARLQMGVQCVEDVLKKLAQGDESSIELIENIGDQIRTSGRDLALFPKMKVKNRKDGFAFETFCKAKGYDGNTLQVFVTVIKDGVSGTRLVAETHVDEALALLREVVIRNGEVLILPKDGSWATCRCDWYRSRGFRVPLRFPISAFLGDSESDTRTSEGTIT